MKYLIGIDLDGTLLPDDHQVKELTINTIKKINDKGHIVVLVTGRSYEGAINYYQELGLKTPMITLHGGTINFLDNEPISDYIDSKMLKDLYSNLKDYINSAIFNTNKEIYVINYNKQLEFVFNGANTTHFMEFDSNNISEKIVNIAVEVKNEFKNEFESYFKDSILTCRSWFDFNGVTYYDIHIRKVTKANSILKVLKHYNLTTDTLITIGDGPNDVEMLSLTKYGTAMKNARLEVKQFASNTTKYDNNNDGVGHYLNELLEKGIL